MQPKLWNQSHFRLGDPKLAWWWANSARHLNLELSESDVEELGLWSDVIRFAPCDFEDLEEDVLVFHFDKGSTLEFVVRHHFYMKWIPHSAFRLSEVSGVFEGERIRINDDYRLAAFGSGPANRHEVPALAFLYRELSETAVEGEYCGLLLTPRRQELPAGARWKINRIDCRGKYTDETIEYLSSESPSSLPLPE